MKPKETISFRTRRKIRLLWHQHTDPFVFIHINKTGGSSIEHALNLPLEHKTAREKIRQLGPAAWAQRLSFTVVRNPWDRVVSQYHYRVDTNQNQLGDGRLSFLEWLALAYGEKDPRYHDEGRFFMPQVNWILDENGDCLVDDILRFENLGEDFDRLLQKLNRRASLPHVKQSKRNAYRDYYDAESREHVAAWFARDIEQFGYAF